MSVVRVEGIELREEIARLEAVDPGVDLRRRELVGREGFLFDDGSYVGCVCADAEYAAIASGVRGHGGKYGHGSMLAEVQVADGDNGLRADEGHVSRENEKMFGEWRPGEFEVGLEHLHGVAGAALLGLYGELDTGRGDGRADAVGLVADDAEDVVRGDDGFGGGDHMKQERASTDFVENLRTSALEPRAFAGGHNGDGETVHVHTGISSHGCAPWAMARRAQV